MKLRIGDTEYDYQTALNKVSLGVLMDLKSQGGPGRRSIELALHLINTALTNEDDDDSPQTDSPETPDAAEAIWDDERVMAGMVGLAFVSKRHAGEPFTWTEACSLSWSDLQFIPEPDDLVEPDPTPASGEANPPGAETSKEPTSKRKTAATGTSKTSSKASTQASA